MMTMHPVVLVIFGGTGDLFRRKLAPSLYTLFEERSLPANMLILGTGRTTYSDEDYRRYTKDAVRELLGITVSDEFLAKFKYVNGEVGDAHLYESLTRVITTFESECNDEAHISWYCSIGSHLYEPIAMGIHSHTPFLQRRTKQCSLLIEKPIGHNEESSNELNSKIQRHFREEQITRIEHYLTKETLVNIPSFLNKHQDIADLLTGDSVEHIEVNFSETLGVEKRGAFYDSVGAFRDVGQNHMLEMLAITSMNVEYMLDEDSARKGRIKFLTEFSKFATKPEVKRFQYYGYREITGVGSDSTVETAFEIKDVMPAGRWKSIPCILKGGKRIDVKKKSIVFFMHAGVLYKGKKLATIEVSIDPECVKLCFSDTSTEVFEFRPGHVPKYQYVEEYAKILSAAFSGSQTYSISSKELSLLWRIADRYTSQWSEKNNTIIKYEPGTSPFIS